MAFVEYLRVRRSLVIFAVVLALTAATIAISIAVGFHNGRHEISVTSGGRAAVHTLPASLAELTFTIPVGFVFAIAGFCAIVMATIPGASLNKESGRGGFAFTKPISRERLALTYFGVDLAGIAMIYAYTVLLSFATFAALGILGKVVLDGSASPVAVAGLGAALMWYGLLQATTAFRVGHGGLTVGLSWPFFLVAAAMYDVSALGPIFHALVVAVDFFNPLAYYSIHSHNDSVAVSSLFGFAPAVAASITWCIGLAACAAAIAGWKRLET